MFRDRVAGASLFPETLICCPVNMCTGEVFGISVVERTSKISGVSNQCGHGSLCRDCKDRKAAGDWKSSAVDGDAFSRA